MRKRTLMAEAIQLIVKRAKEPQVAKVEKFLRGFFERQDHADIEQLGAAVVADLVWEAWKLFNQRQHAENKVDIYELKQPAQTGGNRIIINSLNDNMPFLVDSLIGYLSRYGLRARILLRPIFRVRRDNRGQLEDIIPTGGPEKGTLQESFIHCEVTDPYTPDLLKQLKKDIPKIMRDVRLTVSDWHHMRAKVQDAIADLKPIPKILSADQVAEVIDFLQWLDSDHFTFLGYREYKLEERNGIYKPRTDFLSHLGLLAHEENIDLGTFYRGEPLSSETLYFIFQSNPLVVTKTMRISTVHRPVPMDSITIKIYDKKGEVIGLRQFLGLFTSVAYSSSTRDIPLLRRKVLKIVDKAGFSPQWHDGKALIHILDSLPRDELFQATEEELLAISTKVLSIQERPRLALFIRRDHFDRFLSCLVYVPRDRFEYSLTERIAEILKAELKAPVNLISAQYGGLTFARIHYMVAIEDAKSIKYDADKIESRLVKASHSWKDSLLLELMATHGEWEGTSLFRKYANAFKKGYQERFTEKDAVIDIDYIEKVYETGDLGVRIYRPADALETSLKIKLYHIGSPVPLSDVIRVLEDMDLHVVGEFPFTVTSEKAALPIWVHDFETTSRGECSINITEIEDKFIELFQRVHKGQAESDGFNRLVVRAGLDWKECLMLRAYCKYLRQLRIQFSQDYMEQTLVKNPGITRVIRDLFMERFNPKDNKKDQDKLVKLTDKISQLLIRVDNVDEDLILRRYTNLVMSTVRTNFFQTLSTNHSKPYLSFKFESKTLEDIPLPRPLFEIFIYSPRFEAVHLRGGKIARGGIRWSDRKEDYRTEILGLLKAQMVKNAVIVPQGAKGGFILKADIVHMSRDDYMAEGIACYKLMINAMLEITDNLVKGAPVYPQDIVCWDESDSYLVVAADKGTASFSDYANEIAEEKAFWLGDAFASGGSQGYDHKEIGITARGAWESVKRHFWERGIDAEKTELTTIGIGDMSGDVFGNGMLLSKKFKLIAAFNHQHIFIDPYPNPEKSYKERKRMFENRLGWADYNPKLISEGGGVFERKSKTIKISPEIKRLFGVSSNNIQPAELIRAILMVEADLLWLGGIGTFIKAKSESHVDVGDRSNDSVRINASLLKCKVIVEGANLGVTQKGRIEFARSGGSINTDAIDNSAGVDCSDHEVNIKILLRDAMTHKSLTLPKRNELLEKMTNEVASLVLENNYDQNLALSLIHGQGSRVLDTQAHLMRSLEKTGRLDRILESLPDDMTMAEYQATQTNLTRPEIAILLPYAKNALYDHIIGTDLPDEDRLMHFLFSYFPTPIQEDFKRYIAQHPLKREIIATKAVNRIINRMGSAFVHDLQEKLARSQDDILRAYFIASAIYNLDDIWREIDKWGKKMEAVHQIEAFLQVWALKRRVTVWLLRNNPGRIKMSETIHFFKSGVEELYKMLDVCLIGEVKEKLESDHEKYLKLGLSNALSRRLARLDIVASSPDIIEISQQTEASVAFVASLYFAVGSRFGFTWLQNMASTLRSNNAWHRMAVSSIIEDLYLYQGNLTKKILNDVLSSGKKIDKRGSEILNTWVKNHYNEIAIIDQLLMDSRSLGAPDLALLSVVQREVRLLSERS